MKKSRILYASMAGIMALSSVCATAFAEDATTKAGTTGANTYKAVAGFTPPTLNVTVPAELKAVLNPYKIDMKTTLSVADSVTDGIASPEYTISNNDTTMGVKAKAKIAASGLTIVTDSSKVEEGKDKMAYIELKATESADDACTDGKIVFTEEAPEAAVPFLKITKAESASAAATGKFQIVGDIPTEPEEAWTAKDKLTLDVVFDLSPYNPDAGSGGGSGSTWTATGTTAAATLSSSAGTFSNTSGNNYTWTLTATEAASVGSVTPTLNLASGWTVSTATKDSGRALAGTVNTSTGAFEIDNRSASGDTGTVTITIGDGTATENIVISISVTA